MERKPVWRLWYDTAQRYQHRSLKDLNFLRHEAIAIAVFAPKNTNYDTGHLIDPENQPRTSLENADI